MSIVLFTMPPECKASMTPTGVKQTKKGNNSKNETVPALSEDNENEKEYLGKKMHDNRNNETAFCNFVRKDLSPELLDKNTNIKAAAFPNMALNQLNKQKSKTTNDAEFPNLELNQMLKQKSKTNLQGSIRWKIYLFPPSTQLPSFASTNKQYFGLDLIDDAKELPFWTHKTSVWKDIFELVKQLAQSGRALPICPIFDGILSCPLRATPYGPNVMKKFTAGKIKISSIGFYLFQCHLMRNALSIYRNFWLSFKPFTKIIKFNPVTKVVLRV